jgi:predicted kinase
MLKGLPASGKSTYAKELVAQGYKRVNKDDLRFMIDNGKWSKNNEENIKATEYAMASTYLDNGFHVVVDDTNFAYEDMWRETAKECEAEFEVVSFNTPVHECVRRDSLRGDRSVGADVIYRMYRQYCKPKRVPYDSKKIDAYIFDVDGTLAEMTKRGPFEWDRVGEDNLKEDVAAILDALKEQGNKIIIVSGRDGVSKFDTEAWLDFHDIEYDKIFMRPDGDKRKDSEIKKEIYETYIKDKYNVLGVFDDRDQVVDLWRSLGLTCFQVDYGAF